MYKHSLPSTTASAGRIPIIPANFVGNLLDTRTYSLLEPRSAHSREAEQLVVYATRGHEDESPLALAEPA